MFIYMLTCRLDRPVRQHYHFTMLIIHLNCMSYMGNSDMSYMTYVICDQFGYVIYVHNNFSTHLLELFMVIFNLLSCNAEIQ